MLHLLLIALVVSMFAADALGTDAHIPDVSAALATILTLGAQTGVALGVLAWGSRCARRLGASGNGAWVARAQMGGDAARWLSTGVHAFAVVALGWLDIVRTALGDWILLDEAVATLPTLVAYFASWVSFGRIDRMLWDASLVRTLDAGRPVHRPRGALEYGVDQFRHGAAIVLVPLAMIWSWSEGLVFAADGLGVSLESTTAQAAMAGLQFVGVLIAFLLTPPLMMRLWRTVPLGPGEARDRLQALCARHRVRCRDIRVWRTDGAMINGAVVGILGPVRYILLTDALLESLPEEQVEAVTAHEIAHIRRRHLPWLLGAMLASLWFGSAVILLPVEFLSGAFSINLSNSVVGQAAEIVALAGSVVLAILVFGIVSRAFERQADAFAAQSLSGLDTPAEREGRITPEATSAMAGALGAVARLNAIPAQRFFWRHGSIQGRRQRILGMVGSPVRWTPADRVARTVKIATAAALLVMLGVEGLLAVSSIIG